MSLVTAERPHRLWLRNLRAALFAGTTRIVIPEIKHRLGKMLDDVAAIEIDVLDQRTAVFAIENDVFVFFRRTPSLDHDTDGVRRTDGRVRNVGWNEKSFSFAYEVIDNLVPFPNPDFDVAFELIKIFLGIDFVKIVPRVRPFNHHHEKIAPVVKITIADGGFEFVAVRFDPTL